MYILLDEASRGNPLMIVAAESITIINCHLICAGKKRGEDYIITGTNIILPTRIVITDYQVRGQ